MEPLFEINDNTEKTPQNCPDWIKITEISHPALVPSFIGRRECLPDGSIDPNTVSISTQMSLLGSSSLSPSLASVIGNIPSSLMCESIHRRNLKESKDSEVDITRLKKGFTINLPPSHYKRTIDPITIPSASSAGSAAQTAAELSSLNILYGGVRGKAYLNSLNSFVSSCEVEKGSQVEKILKEKLDNAESVCGYKIFNIFPTDEDDGNTDLMMNGSESSPTDILLEENAKLLKQLNRPESFASPESRQELLISLKANLSELMRNCPQEIREECFKGVDVDISV
jgi:hypothetical protein